ncbi:uncharacterized protein LOC110019966 [Phalaenopsis equestris]|uniref:uncharacterized protein LOC110019966 n=1 Tax=Phalaenopsis equestris TaxID=78828 RepID=UPI0009E55657|nr:uncharacterized protein LOC110019966 [Phalaenopsis equestris]
MNLVEVNRCEELSSLNEKFFAQTSSSNRSSPVSASTDDIFGDPILSPCVGDDYQVEIPSMLVDSLHLRASELPCKTGLSIPIMWVHTDDAKRELKDYCTSLGSRCLSNGFNHSHLPSLCSVLKAEIMQINECNGCSPLPESRVSLWSEEEIQSFLLGLYIFRKNLVQVKKFIGCKDMKDVLSFYYGKFYRSEAYHRWADCRKSRSRKCIQGQRIFTGWRQQELLSRLLMGMPKEEQDLLIEATKAFNEGKSSLEELVFTLKAAVGVVALVEAVAIGKGKQDLTGFMLDPNRTNQPILSRAAEIPTGKACSTLALNDIIKFLTGDFRLSKAKSNDLFWEAVWPRLLARGWHSETPKHFCTKNTIVFLIPDVRKFSRKLVKGDQYFDSVMDVLSKVASDPQLLELTTEGEEGNVIANGESLTAAYNHRHPSYLRSRFADCNADFIKFTVVDTSLVDVAAGSSKLRGLRSLPFEVAGHTNMEKTNCDSSTEHSTDSFSSNKVSSDQPESLPNDSKPEGGNIQLNETIQIAPLLKRQRLSACKQAMRNGCHKLFAEKIDSDSDMKAVETSEKASSTKSSGSSFEDSFYHEKRPRALFDLNQPQFPLDFDMEPMYRTSKPQSFDGFRIAWNQNSSADEEPSSNAQRHGNRNRLPTAKALEAFACGFLSVGRIGKEVKRTRLHGIRSRSRRKAEAPLPSTAIFAATAPTIDFIDPNLVIPEVRYHTNLFAEPQIKCERTEAHELLGLF